jgi:hypothetical protein
VALPTVIAKNQTGTPIFLPRLGLTCPATPGTITLTNFATFFEVASEEVLETRVAAGDIVINDGSNDLSTAEALAYLNATGNMNGPVDAPATNALVKLADASGRYTNATGITVDGSDNMDLQAGNVTTTGTVDATTINVGGSPIALNDLSDTTLTSVAQGDVFYNNGTAWVNLPAGTAGQVFQTNGSGSNPAWADNAGATALGGTWRFSSTTTTADPGSKNFRLNNATQASATEMYINDVAQSNVDMSTILANLSTDNRIYIQDEGDATLFHLIRVTGTPTDNTGWFTVPIAVESSGTDLSNNNNCGFIFFFTSSAGAASTLQSAYDAGNTIVTASSNPISFTLTSGGFTVNGAGAVDFGNTGTDLTGFAVGTSIFNIDATGAITLDSTGGSITLTAGAQVGISAVGNIQVNSSSGAVRIDGSGVVEINSSGGVIGIGNDAVAQDINVGTGAAVRTVTVGNVTGASAVDLAAGTGNTNVTTGMTWNGVISPTSLSVDQDDYTPTNLSTATVIRQAASADVNITGLTGGVSGRIIVLTNISAFTITLTNEDVGSTAANRFLFGDFIRLFPEDSLILQYDGTSSRWRAPATSRGSVAGQVKTLFTQFGSNASTAKGEHNTVTVGSNGSLNLEARIPPDFTALISLAAIMIPGSTNAAANIDLSSTYAATGEAFDLNTETNATITFNVTLDVMTLIEASSVVTGISADDFVGILFDHKSTGGTSYYLGMVLTYT